MKLSDLFRTSKQGKSSAFIQFWNNLRKRVRRSRVSEKPRLSTADKPLKDTASANSSGRQVVDKPEKKAVSPEVHRELADDSRSDVTVVPVDNTDSQSAVIEETDSKNDELRRFDTDESSGKQEIDSSGTEEKESETIDVQEIQDESDVQPGIPVQSSPVIAEAPTSEIDDTTISGQDIELIPSTAENETESTVSIETQDKSDETSGIATEAEFTIEDTLSSNVDESIETPEEPIISASESESSPSQETQGKISIDPEVIIESVPETNVQSTAGSEESFESAEEQLVINSNAEVPHEEETISEPDDQPAPEASAVEEVELQQQKENQLLSVFEVLDLIEDERTRLIVQERLQGTPVDQIAEELQLTRQRVYMIFATAYIRLKQNYLSEYGETEFSEDRYAALYRKYDVPKELLVEYLEASDTECSYLRAICKRGSSEINEALNDSSLDEVIRSKIAQYLERNYIIVGDVRARKARPDLDELTLRLYLKYQFSPRSFVAITGKGEDLYRYLLTRYPKGHASILSLADDNEFPRETRDRATAYLQGITSARESRKRDVKTARPAIYTPENSQVFKNLEKKVLEQFNSKFYIGDIPINDEEYEELKGYLKTQIQEIPVSTPIGDSPLLCIALVQIGIKTYDSNYWGNVGKELGLKIPSQLQTFLGRSFVLTLLQHGKFILNENERVNSILFHTFVCDHYADGLFEFLFQYYRKDLERDINRNTPEQMQSLMDTLDRTASMDDDAAEELAAKLSGSTGGERGSRSYKLRHHTLDAISANQDDSRIRLIGIIQMIDKAFWSDSIPEDPSARLTKLFIEWTQHSPSFNEDYKLYKGGQIRNRGKKHFSSPYLYCDLKKTAFEVILPAQIVNEDYADNLRWEISTSERDFSVPVETLQAVTGFKSEEVSHDLQLSELFGKMEFRLMCGETLVRRLGDIPEADARFFDTDGDYASKLYKIPMSIFTEPGKELRSPALLERVDLGDLLRWDFEFENGDILVLPDGSSLLAGETYDQGLLPRGCVPGVVCTLDGNQIPVYSNVPVLVLTIPENRIPGTAIYLNDTRYQLGECEYVDFESKDSRGERAFLVDLNLFSSINNFEVNKVIVDIPGATYAKPYLFALAEGLTVDFDSAPYIFSERAAVVFSDAISVKALSQATPLRDENGFIFELSENTTVLPVELGEKHLKVDVEIPVFMWSRDASEWCISPLGDIWITEFPTEIFLRTPSRKTRFLTDMEIGGEASEDEPHSIDSVPRSDGIHVVDFTRMKTWLTRDKLAHDITLRIDGKNYAFAKVYVKSYVARCDISSDFDTQEILCQTEIIGKADYYLEITNQTTGEKIADKLLFDGKSARVRDKLLNGKYMIEIFEAEEDESGFDEPEYYSIYKCFETIIDKSNLSGRYIELKGFRPHNSGMLTTPRLHYWINNLVKESGQNYTGDMYVPGDADSSFKIHIHFKSSDDLRYFDLQRWYEEDEDPDALMFDRQHMEFVKEEQSGLHGRTKYLRYQMLYPEDYYYFGILKDQGPSDQEVERWKREQEKANAILWIDRKSHEFQSIPISEMNLSIRSYNCLRRARLMTAGDIAARTPGELLRVRNLGRKAVDEVIAIMKKLGCPEDSPLLRKEPEVSDPPITEASQTEDTIQITPEDQKLDLTLVTPSEEITDSLPADEETDSQQTVPDIDLHELKLSDRVLAGLLSAGYKTYADIKGLGFQQLYSIKGFSRADANEVILTRHAFQKQIDKDGRT